MQGTPEDRPIGELFSKLASDVSLLIRQEIALAKKELSQTLSQALGSAVSLIVGALVAYVGLLALIAALILGLARTMDAWLAALIVGGVLALLGLILILVGVNRIKRVQLVPPRTSQTLKEDAEMLKEKAR
jgi:predicted phage tail protein